MLHFRKGEKLKKKNGKKIETGNDMIMYFDLFQKPNIINITTEALNVFTHKKKTNKTLKVLTRK